MGLLAQQYRLRDCPWRKAFRAWHEPTLTAETRVPQESSQALKNRVLEHWDLLDRLAQRRFRDQNLADEALLFVQQALADDDWRRVRAYRGEVEFSRFLSHVTYRLLEDFARHKFGRVRPPVWLKRMGSLWLRVFQLLCLERRSVGDVLETLAGGRRPERDPAAVKEATAAILSRIPSCGSKSAQKVSVDNELVEAEMSQDPALHNLDPEEHAAKVESAAALAAFSIILDPLGVNEENLESGAFRKLLETLRSNLELCDEDRFFLCLIYQDGLNVSAAGRRLQLRADQAHGRLQRILGRIRSAVETAGLKEDMRLLLKIADAC